MSIHFQAKHLSGFTVHSPLQPVVFPDGAVHIKGADVETEYEYQIADVRGLSHDDLFLLAMWGEACDDRGEEKILLLPYLPGARMDRGQPNGSFVYAEFINKIVRPDRIITLDPHSEAATLWYPKTHMVRDHESKGKGVRVKQVPYLTVFPVERIIRREVQDASRDLPGNHDYVGVIAPDKGAHERAAAAAKVMGVPVYTGGKTRDFETGKLSGFHMEDELPAEGKLLIVDDICDGGGTFIGLAEATGLPKERLDLWVTHGIFSKGFGGLFDHFGIIHTTDSYFNMPQGSTDRINAATGDDFNNYVKVHKLAPYLYAEVNIG